jgi:hypothetical protein
MSGWQEQHIGELGREFGDCVAAQSDAIARGDADTGNKFAQRYIDIFGEIRRRGDGARDALAVLLEDARPPVRVMVAAYLLRHSGAHAKAILEKEAQGKGINAFAAKQALKRWHDGTWQLDRE